MLEVMFKYWFIDETEQNRIFDDYKFINGLKFDFKYRTKRKESEYVELDSILNPWLNQLTMRLLELRFTIVNFLYYSDKKVDDRTICELNTGGKKFFPNLTEEERYYQFALNYFYGNFQIQYITILDGIYHVLNIYYGIDISSSSGFGKAIIKKMHDKNYGISKALEDFWKDCKIHKYRNDKVHNYDPNIPDKGYVEGKGGTQYYCPIYIHSIQKYRLLEEECIKMENLLKNIRGYMLKDSNKHLSKGRKRKVY